MPANIEIKARVSDPDQLRELVTAIAEEEEIIHQKDTFFVTKQGRLKLREFSPKRGQLIYYERADQTGPKESKYRITETSDPRGLCAALDNALGIIGVVKNVRHLHLAGQTRIHLDHVEGLGHYMELEVVLDKDQTSENGIDIANGLMKQLAIRKEDLVDKAYVDLLTGT